MKPPSVILNPSGYRVLFNIQGFVLPRREPINLGISAMAAKARRCEVSKMVPTILNTSPESTVPYLNASPQKHDDIIKTPGERLRSTTPSGLLLASAVRKRAHGASDRHPRFHRHWAYLKNVASEFSTCVYNSLILIEGSPPFDLSRFLHRLFMSIAT